MPKIPMAERLEVLTRNEGWFGRAPKAFQDAVLSRCEWRVCPAGQMIYQATDEQADFCGVADGTVDFYSRFGAGDNPLLHIAHEGFWIGYGTVVAGERPRATMVARVDTLLACVPERVLRELLNARPEWWRVIATGILEYGDTAISAYVDALIPLEKQTARESRNQWVTGVPIVQCRSPVSPRTPAPARGWEAD
jgi:hypothetical protein